MSREIPPRRHKEHKGLEEVQCQFEVFVIFVPLWLKTALCPTHPIMSLLVVGSVAIDSVQTPTQVRERILGGSASYFSYSASFFGPVRLVGVVGEDFPPEHVELLKSRQIDTSGLHVIPGGKTFFWKGKYQPNMNDRETLEVQ